MSKQVLPETVAFIVWVTVGNRTMLSTMCGGKSVHLKEIKICAGGETRGYLLREGVLGERVFTWYDVGDYEEAIEDYKNAANRLSRSNHDES